MSIDVSEAVEALSKARTVVAMSRALKRCNVVYRIGNEGQIIITDEDIHDLDAFLENSIEFHEAFEDELKRLVLDDTLASLVEKGLLDVTIDVDSGQLMYTATDKARELRG